MKHTNITETEKYQMPIFVPLISGCVARCFAVTVVNPLELIRTKMQSEKMSYSDVGKAFKQMTSSYGVRGLFKGLFPTIMRDAPFSSIYWASYETYKRVLEISQPGFIQSFTGGALSGCIAAFITTPFDVIKTHQQIEFGEKFIYSSNGNGKKKQMTTTMQTMRNIMRSGGIPGFFAGVIPRLFKVVMACGIMISSYEVGKTFFHGYNVRMYHEKRAKNFEG